MIFLDYPMVVAVDIVEVIEKMKPLMRLHDETAHFFLRCTLRDFELFDQMRGDRSLNVRLVPQSDLAPPTRKLSGSRSGLTVPIIRLPPIFRFSGSLATLRPM